MATDAAGPVGVLELAEPAVPSTPVPVLELPAEPAIEPSAVSVLPEPELPVFVAAGAVAVLPVAGVVPAGALIELPTALPVPDSPVAVVDEAGPVLDPLVIDDGTAGAALALLTDDGWVMEGTRATFLTAGRDGAGGVTGCAGAVDAAAAI
jgi:hypothetical protein